MNEPSPPAAPPVAPQPSAGSRRLEAAVVAACLVCAAALLTASLASYLSARSALGALARGQAEGFLRAVRRDTERGWSREELARLVETRHEDGLRCVAVFGPGLRVAASAGDCALDAAGLERAVRELPPSEPIRVGDRLRVVDHAPPPGPRPPGSAGLEPARPRPARDAPLRPRPPRDAPPQPRPARDAPPPPPAPGRRGPPGREARQVPVLIEFEPLLTRSLDTAATRSLGVGVAASLLLASAAVLLRRLSTRAVATQHRIESERHLASLGEMSAVLAHEIRNPLASMKGHAQLLVEQLPPDAPEHAKAARIVAEAVRLEKLAADLLDFVRARSIDKREADPLAVLRAAVTDAPGTVTVDADGAPVRWLLDPDRMRQALGNLLANALQTCPEPPPRAGVASEAGSLVFQVRDHGPGVRPDDREAIFEPFHTTRPRGTGLGLAVARRIVEGHGGSLGVSTHPEGGAVFEARIPAR